jgi:hypothetical protein
LFFSKIDKNITTILYVCANDFKEEKGILKELHAATPTYVLPFASAQKNDLKDENG